MSDSVPLDLSEEDIIKRKLMFDADGVGDDRRINLMIKSFFQWLKAPEGTEKDLDLQRLFLMLNDAEIAMKKSTAVREMNHREFKNYESLTKQLDERIESSKTEITSVKEELVQAKACRKNRMEYEPLVSKIQDLPSRDESKAKLEAIKKEMAELEVRREEINKKLEQRKVQFEALVKMASEINQSLIQDERDLAAGDENFQMISEVMEGPVEPPIGGTITPGGGSPRDDEDIRRYDRRSSDVTSQDLRKDIIKSEPLEEGEESEVPMDADGSATPIKDEPM